MNKIQLPKNEQEWRDRLTPEQYHICREKGTEPAFTGKYYTCTEDGIYLCSCCGQKLFKSEHKYDSGSGWPSFYHPAHRNAIKTTRDHSHNMVRTEVTCSRCNAHLGHVFEDGPEPSGLRYCINSLSLELEKQEN